MRMSFYTKKTDSSLPKQHISNAFCEFSRAQRQNPVYMKNKQASLASVHLYRLKNISNIQASWCQQFGPLRPQRFIAGTFSHITKSTVLNDVFRVLTCTGPHVFLVAILEGLGVWEPSTASTWGCISYIFSGFLLGKLQEQQGF